MIKNSHTQIRSMYIDMNLIECDQLPTSEFYLDRQLEFWKFLPNLPTICTALFIYQSYQLNYRHYVNVKETTVTNQTK